MLLTALGWALAASSADSPTDFLPGLGQLGLGALIVAPSYAAVWALWRRNLASISEYDARIAAMASQHSAELAEKDRTIAELQESRRADLLAQVSRERDLSSRIIPTLAESAEVIARAPSLYRRAAEEQKHSDEVRQVLADLQALLPELREKHLGGG